MYKALIKPDAIKVSNIQEVVINRSKRHSTTFRIKPDGTYCYVIEGKEISEQELHKLYPTTTKPKKNKNYDRRHHWMHDESSISHIK